MKSKEFKDKLDALARGELAELGQQEEVTSIDALAHLLFQHGALLPVLSAEEVLGAIRRELGEQSGPDRFSDDFTQAMREQGGALARLIAEYAPQISQRTQTGEFEEEEEVFLLKFQDGSMLETVLQREDDNPFGWEYVLGEPGEQETFFREVSLPTARP